MAMHAIKRHKEGVPFTTGMSESSKLSSQYLDLNTALVPAISGKLCIPGGNKIISSKLKSPMCQHHNIRIFPCVLCGNNPISSKTPCPRCGNGLQTWTFLGPHHHFNHRPGADMEIDVTMADSVS